MSTDKYSMKHQHILYIAGEQSVDNKGHKLIIITFTYVDHKISVTDTQFSLKTKKNYKIL